MRHVNRSSFFYVNSRQLTTEDVKRSRIYYYACKFYRYVRSDIAMLAMSAVKNNRASAILPTATLKLLARAYTAGGAGFVSSRI